MFDKWLRQPGGSPGDVALKTRLKDLLGAPRPNKALSLAEE
jgi:hypothetical protein